MKKQYLESLKDGYTFNEQGIITNPGKFQGETIATLYFYDCFLNGDGVVFEVNPDEKRTFNINLPFVFLAESNDGFVSLEYYQTLEQAENRELEDYDDMGDF